MQRRIGQNCAEGRTGCGRELAVLFFDKFIDFFKKQKSIYNNSSALESWPPTKKTNKQGLYRTNTAMTLQASGSHKEGQQGIEPGVTQNLITQ